MWRPSRDGAFLLPSEETEHGPGIIQCPSDKHLGWRQPTCVLPARICAHRGIPQPWEEHIQALWAGDKTRGSWYLSFTKLLSFLGSHQRSPLLSVKPGYLESAFDCSVWWMKKATFGNHWKKKSTKQNVGGNEQFKSLYPTVASGHAQGKGQPLHATACPSQQHVAKWSSDIQSHSSIGMYVAALTKTGLFSLDTWTQLVGRQLVHAHKVSPDYFFSFDNSGARRWDNHPILVSWIYILFSFIRPPIH